MISLKSLGSFLKPLTGPSINPRRLTRSVGSRGKLGIDPVNNKEMKNE